MENLIVLITCKLAALAGLQQMLEYALLRKEMSQTGVWSTALLKEDCQTAFGQKIFSFLFSNLSLLFIIALGLVSAAGIFLYPEFAISLFICSLLMSLRFRGNFNGGADSMTTLILGSLVLCIFKIPMLTKIALCYIGVQCALSYFVGGIVKIKNPDWRSGKVLQEILQHGVYEVPPRIKKMADNSSAMFFLSWTTIIFECAFPLSFLNTKLALGFIFIGFLFHAANVYVLGLNRFFLAWLAAYPALVYCGMIFRSAI